MCDAKVQFYLSHCQLCRPYDFFWLIPDQFVGHRSLASYEKSQRYTMMILKIHHLQLGKSIRMAGLSVLDSKGLLTPLFVLNTTLSKDFILRGYWGWRERKKQHVLKKILPELLINLKTISLGQSLQLQSLHRHLVFFLIPLHMKFIKCCID